MVAFTVSIIKANKPLTQIVWISQICRFYFDYMKPKFEHYTFYFCFWIKEIWNSPNNYSVTETRFNILERFFRNIVIKFAEYLIQRCDFIMIFFNEWDDLLRIFSWSFLFCFFILLLHAASSLSCSLYFKLLSRADTKSPSEFPFT